MPKLHEVLAVNDQLKGQAVKTRTDLAATFANKRHLFESKLVTFTSFDENAKAVTESQSSISSSVRRELAWLSTFLTKHWDNCHQIAVANCTAKADVVTDAGVMLAKDVPATSLLELEKRLAEVLELVKGLPTLDSAKAFVLDANQGQHIYQAREVIKTRTKKDKKVLELAKATDKHPAQVQVLDVDVPVGTVIEKEWSSLITPSDKSDMVARAEEVLRAIKAARSRANDCAVEKANTVANPLLEYIFGK